MWPLHDRVAQQAATFRKAWEGHSMRRIRQISPRQARLIGNCLYLDWEQVDLEQFRRGLMGTQRAARDGNSIDEDVLLAGRAVLAHMRQFPDYLVRLARLRAEARANHKGQAAETLSTHR
jgi:hypothetical protein